MPKSRSVRRRSASYCRRAAAAIRRLTLVDEEFEAAAKQADFRPIHELNDQFRTERLRLCANDLIVSLIETSRDLTYAVRGAAFADPGPRTKLEPGAGS